MYYVQYIYVWIEALKKADTLHMSMWITVSYYKSFDWLIVWLPYGDPTVCNQPLPLLLLIGWRQEFCCVSSADRTRSVCLQWENKQLLKIHT